MRVRIKVHLRMETSPRTSSTPPQVTADTSKKPRRRRCDNCNALMKPGKKAWKRFCGPEDSGQGLCRAEFHRNGGAFGPLKIKLEKLVAKMARERLKETTDQVDALEKRVAQLEDNSRVEALRDRGIRG
jgi:hypothetical protein